MLCSFYTVTSKWTEIKYFVYLFIRYFLVFLCAFALELLKLQKKHYTFLKSYLPPLPYSHVFCVKQFTVQYFGNFCYVIFSLHTCIYCKVIWVFERLIWASISVAKYMFRLILLIKKYNIKLVYCISIM